ncbi:MAG: hypothetical protein ACI837_002175 [Crocinitomicaceae bacterium]|jgi:hypothetical protein
MRIHFLFAIVVLVLFSNCTIQKRVHRPGWHIEWKKNYKSDRSKETSSPLNHENLSTQKTTTGVSDLHEENSIKDSEVEEVNTLSTSKTIGEIADATLESKRQIDQNYPTELIDEEQQKISPVSEEEEYGEPRNPWAILVFLGLTTGLIGLVITAVMSLFSAYSVFAVILLITGMIELILAVAFTIRWKKKHLRANEIDETSKAQKDQHEPTEEDLAEKKKKGCRVLLAMSIALLFVMMISIFA